MSQASTQKQIIRAVVLDVDGTLICRDGTVCTPNRTAIERLCMADVPVILATGRTPGETLNFYRTLGLSTPLVCYHGALVLAGDDVPAAPGATADCNCAADSVAQLPQAPLFDAPLPADAARNLVQFINQLSADAQILLATHERYIINRIGPLASYWDMSGPSRPHIGPFDDFFSHPIYKVCYFSEDLPQVADVAARISEHFGPAFQRQQAHGHLIEFLAPGVSKAAGVDIALRHLDRDWNETMAIGDFHNDMEMVRRAAIGVAMGNACPELKAIADYVTGDRDEGGVAEAIDRFVSDA